MVWEMKLVSTRTEYGGARAVLYWKKRDEGAWGLEVGLAHGLEGSSSGEKRGCSRLSNHIVLVSFGFLLGLVVFLTRVVGKVSR